MTKAKGTQPIQKQLDEISKTLARILQHVTRSSHGQTSLILRDLNEISDAVMSLKSDVTEYFDVYQKQVGALMGVGSVINSTRGLKHALEEVMDAVIGITNAERGFLMLKEPNGELKIRVARGMSHENLSQETLSVSRTLIRNVVENGEAVVTTNAQDDPRFLDQKSITAFRLLSILCAPLKLKDDLIGVIYVDHRAHTGLFNSSDLRLISAFADQAALAIHTAKLIDDLQASNQELELAYQNTLEGLVHAIDLRDKETERHTQRVTTLTRQIAEAMGIAGEELMHITRGALLHDIGKIAIPDGILLKPDTLSPAERMIMQEHPRHAYELLYEIKFLRPALDIPYCHHEKWDGSGYPRGLKGEEIPLAARIFAVVDVWDALVSNRPYRKGLRPADVRNHIKELAGSHFDPQVVEVFLSLKIK